MVIYIIEDYKEKAKSTKELSCLAVYDFLNKASKNLNNKIKLKDIIIEKTELGKPFVKKFPIFLSISHSDNICAIAVSFQQVGIDIEKKKNVKWQKIMERFFTEREKNILEKNPDIDVFFDIWTRKEAYAKYLGIPVLRIIKTENVVEVDTVENDGESEKSMVSFKKFYVNNNFVGNVCCRNEEKDVNYERRDLFR